MSGRIVKVSDPLVVAEGLSNANMADVVKVGKLGLRGEILTMTGDRASIQVYEETAGIGPGDQVSTTGAPLSVELGPGLLENIYDGIQRPLTEIRAIAGSTITRGIDIPALNREKKWVYPSANVGDSVEPGDIIGTVQRIFHCPQNHGLRGIKGTVEKIFDGSFTVTQTVAAVKLRTGASEK